MPQRNSAPGAAPPAASPVSGTILPGKPWFFVLMLAIMTFAAYQPVWHAGFIWDDDDHLTANPAMTAPDGLRMIWSSLAVSRYYPLTLTTFWVQRRLWGLNPMPYHLVNIALHAINGVLVFFVLRRLRVPGAWFAAMLWTLHPVNVESVAWITELKNTQSGLFFLVSVLCFLHVDRQKNHRWYSLALVCAAAAMLSKPSTVILPLALLLCAWWERGRWRNVDWLRIAPVFFLALAMSGLAVLEQQRQIHRERTAEWTLAIPERFAIAGKAVWFYAAKVLWPSKLAFVYPRWAVDAGSLSSWIPLSGLLAVAVVLLAWRRRDWSRAGLFGCGFFVAALLPVLGFLDVFYFRYSFVADHFQYLASLGLITLIAAAGVSLCSRVGRQGARIGVVAAAVLLAISATLTWRQAHIYRNAETLWRDTLAKNPRCWLAHTNLGVELEKSGRFQEAMSHYRLALLSNPSFAEAHYDLGTVLMRAGTRRDAIAHLEQAVQLRPDWPPPKNNLAWALATFPRTEGGDPRRATEVAENLGNLSGNRSPDYLDTMAVAYAAAGRFSEAIATAQKAIDLARAAGQPKLAAEIEARLQLYRSGRAYHEPLSNKP